MLLVGVSVDNNGESTEWNWMKNTLADGLLDRCFRQGEFKDDYDD